jgi:hypothetical protein
MLLLPSKKTELAGNLSQAPRIDKPPPPGDSNVLGLEAGVAGDIPLARPADER